MSVIDKIFLHFYDTHFIDEKLGTPLPAHIREIETATIFSLLFSKITYIPLASFIESDLCRKVLSNYQDLFQYGIIEFVGKGANINEYLHNKNSQYLENTSFGKKYREFNDLNIPIPFKDKTGSTTDHIVNQWNEVLVDFDSFISIFDKHYTTKQIDGLAKKWEKVPIKLQSKAFILENVKPILDNKIHTNINILYRLHRIINSAYFHHFITTFDCGIVSDMVYLDYAPLAELTDKTLPFRYILQAISSKVEYKSILDPNPEKLLLNRNSEMLHEIYYRGLEIKAAEIQMHQKHSKLKDMPKKEKVIGVVTALPKEFAAMRFMIEDEFIPQNIPKGDPNDYRIGYITNRNSEKIKVVIAVLKEMGTNNASSVTSHMLRTFEEIEQVLLVGIAGGTPSPKNPEDHVRLGDIVCSNKILQYDNIKQTSKEVKIRSNTDKPSSIILGKKNILDSEMLMDKYPWEQSIQNISDERTNFKKPDISTDILKIEGVEVSHPEDNLRREENPRIFIGCIGSSDTLLKDEERRNYLRDNFGVRAIEMEGSGVANGTWTCEKSYFVVRGIVDYCNDDKSDLWHNYAALCAASYAKSIIELL